ncbi:MAG: hypothetical protein GY778_07005 [bacterium]|nr:hypothetical protein [bacterium]
MSRRAHIALCGLIATHAVGLASAPALGRVLGRVVHVGFPSLRGHVVRPGAWVPVAVELSLEGQDSFEGSLRVEQPDQDGDLVYDEVPVQLHGVAASRRYVLYCLAQPTTGRPTSFEIELLDATGAVVEVVADGELARSMRPGQPPQRLSDRAYLILSLTSGQKGSLAYLTTPDQQDKFDREMHVAHLEPDELPDRWHGLEMVDCIVWDRADATELTGPQLEALTTWVRQGGVLMMAAARTADTLAASKQLAPMLPVDIGRAISTEKLPTLRGKLLGARPPERPEAEDDDPDQSRLEDEELDNYYPEPLPVVPCATAVGAETVLFEKELDATIIARRRLGRGVVVFVGAELAHLMKADGIRPVEFYKATLQLRGPRGAGAELSPPSANLFTTLSGTVGFRRSTGLYLLGALLFSMVYVGGATFGSWAFLRARGWTRHAWSTFALVAGGAAVLSLMAVQTMRGVGRSLQQLTVVDNVVGTTAATATAYFGIKTGTHTELDLWLPSDYAQETEPGRTDCYLKPMPPGDDLQAGGGGYADPTRNRVLPGSAEVRGVPVRATLKQFEGRWSGHLRRTVDGDITIESGRDDSVDQSAGVITPTSTITNNLGTALTNCYLIQPVGNAFQGTVWIPRGSDAFEGRILVHQLGDIADGEQIAVADRVYLDREVGFGQLSIDQWRQFTLRRRHKEWGEQVRGTLFASGAGGDLRLEQYQQALLLLSTLSEFDPGTQKTTFGSGYDFRSRHCRQLDLSDALTTDHVLLVGFATNQGPVVPKTRRVGGQYQELRATEAKTMYRFLIPVKRQ